MRLRVWISVLLVITSTAANADLFERLKETKAKLKEVESVVRNLGDEIDDKEEVSDKEEIEAIPQPQPQGSDAPVQRSQQQVEVASQIEKTAAEKNTVAYGWLDNLSYSEGRNIYREEMGLKNPSVGIGVTVWGVTSSYSREILCNAVYLDSTVPRIEGLPVEISSNMSPQEINNAFRMHRETFIGLNNLEVFEKQNQKYCKVSSIEVVENVIETNVVVPEVDSRFLANVFDVLIRAGAGNMETYTHLVQNRMGAEFDPIKYDCAQYQWATAEASKAMADEFQKNSYQNIRSAKVEFLGVRPINKIGRCAIDGMKIIANDEVANNAPQIEVPSDSKDDSLFFESIEILVHRVQPSNLDRCKQRNQSDSYPQACTMSGALNTSPRLTFKISSEELARINLRAGSMSYKGGFWKEGYIPEFTDRIENLRGKKIKLINVSVEHARAKGYFFERIVVLEQD